MNETDARADDLPTPHIRTPRRFAPSLIWLVPLVAAVAGIILMVRSINAAGPSISVTFLTAEGLEAGKTEVRYKNVVVGKVQSIRLSPSREHVIVEVELRKDAEEIALEDSRFWVVRPRADLGGISGLGTLLSGAYIGVDVGTSENHRDQFTGLEIPPAVTNDQKGTRFLLSSEDLGSLNIGSPIYYRRIPVGRVVGYDLNPDGNSLTLQAFIDEPYDRFVTSRTRFWNASGVSVDVSASGLKVDSESLVSLLAGGIAFQPQNEENPGDKAKMDDVFRLHSDKQTALAAADGFGLPVRMQFFQSMRGLSVGAPIDFRGLELGKVKSIEINYEREQKRFAAVVTADLFPERLGRAYEQLRIPEGSEPPSPETVFHHMIQRGLRAQLRTGNLITGQLYVALDFLPRAKKIETDPDARPLEIPTQVGSLDQIQTQIADIVAKIDSVPFEEIGTNLRKTLDGADAFLKQVRGELAPEARKTLEEVRKTLEQTKDTIGDINKGLASPDSPLQLNAGQALEQVDRAARSLRNLSDYLQRHPDSLLRGKRESQELLPEDAEE
tara:strand:+ start:4512 stop:6176 length:1665 start_codon:yes stop_codon:yes gene_type:complete